MNRIDLIPESIESIVGSSHVDHSSHGFSALDRSRWSALSEFPHALFTPIHYEPGYAYPLVIWLHSPAGDERQLRRIMPLVSMRNYVAAAPRGTIEHDDQAHAYDWDPSADGIEQTEASVFACLEMAQRRFHIHPDRVFLAGYGEGGTMAVRVGWNNPGRFAGVATLGGPLPQQSCPLRNVNSLRELPCFLATARSSLRYPERDVCRDLRLLHAAGFTVALRQYMCGDDLTTAMLSDLNVWAMELVNAAS